MAIKAWGFEGSGTTPPTPHSAYEGKAATLPAKIEAENYDVPGTGRGSDVKSYNDADSENQGDAEFRTEEGVDIVLGGTGKAIGYTSEGEWLLYTVNVPADGDYAIKASASTGMESAGFKFQVDGKDVGSEITVPQTGEDWSVYKEFDGGKATLTAGEHVIKLVITGTNVNVDWFSFGDVSAAPITPTDTNKVNIGVRPVANVLPSAWTYKVFDLGGNFICTVNLSNVKASDALKQKGLNQGAYMLKNVSSGKSFMAISK